MVFPASRMTPAYLAVENKMKGEESEKACADTQKPARAAVTEKRIVVDCALATYPVA